MDGSVVEEVAELVWQVVPNLRRCRQARSSSYLQSWKPADEEAEKVLTILAASKVPLASLLSGTCPRHHHHL